MACNNSLAFLVGELTPCNYGALTGVQIMGSRHSPSRLLIKDLIIFYATVWLCDYSENLEYLKSDVYLQGWLEPSPQIIRNVLQRQQKFHKTPAKDKRDCEHGTYIFHILITRNKIRFKVESCTANRQDTVSFCY